MWRVMSGETKKVGWFWFWSIVADLATRWQAEVVPAAWSWATMKTRATNSRPLADTQATITGGDVREGDLRSQPP